MKKLLIIGLVVWISVGAVYAATTIKILNSAPDYVSKFYDGRVTCYIMRDYDYKFTNGGSTYGVSYGGLSCFVDTTRLPKN